MIISISNGVMDSAYGKSAEPIKMFIESKNEAWEEKSMIPKIFSMETSSNFAEKFTYETTIGNFEIVGENGNYPEADYQEGYDKVIYPQEFKRKFSISQTLMEDGKAGSVGKKEGGKLVDAWHRTRELFGSTLLTNGIATTMTFGKKTGLDIACADGKALFATDHPSVNGKTSAQSNLYNLEFSYENLTIMETAMQNVKDDDGNKLNLQPDTIIIPNDPRIKAKVFEVLGADYKPGTGDNDSSYNYGRWNIIVWTFLGSPAGMTAGKSWFMIQDSEWNENYAGLVWIDRIDLTIKSEIDADTDANIWRGRGRYGAAPNDWRCMFAGIPGLGTTV